MGVGELIEGGLYLDAVEKALYTKFIDALNVDNWDVIDKVMGLLADLSII